MKIVVAGGSVSGLATAYSLVNADTPDVENIQVIVVEKAKSLTSAGAGLGLDPQTCRALTEWNLEPSFQEITIPLSIDENRATDSHSKDTRVLARDENFNFRAAHWSDLHKLLFQNLPENTVNWGHEVISFHRTPDNSGISVEIEDVSTKRRFQIDCDLLVAADDSLSSICGQLLPDIQHRRYLGYCAWRGVYDYSDNESCEIVCSLRSLYPDLGNCLYFDIAQGTHSVLYELPGKRINWIWYVNQPEPEMKTNSVTIKADRMAIERMQRAASETWRPELASLMKATTDPFINILYDRDPIDSYVMGRVVLVGEAAHPTSPHGLRSTNMSIIDAKTLGESIAKWGFSNIEKALAEYQTARLVVTSKQVLHSRQLGLLKQGLVYNNVETLSWRNADSDQCKQLLQRNMPFLHTE